MIQTRKTKKHHRYIIYNTFSDDQLEINRYSAYMLRKYYKNNKIDELENHPFTNDLFNKLKEVGIIAEKETTSGGIYLGQKCKYKLPLTAFTIELTNRCNLKCKHCYGAFGKNTDCKIITYEWIQNNIPEFNRLHMNKIALTGGEVTTHPDFLKIVELLLFEGFELCILSNGYNFKVIEELLDRTRNYQYTIKISLDGPEEMHNKIRCVPNAYENAMKSLKAISACPNITLFISTTVMKDNIELMKTFHKEVAKLFPNAIHTDDLVFPMGNGLDCAFGVDDFDYVREKVPSLFSIKRDEDKDPTRKMRCSAGITQATLMPNGKLKICNAAISDVFSFKYNVFEKGLGYAWENCGENILKYRKEKKLNTTDCKRCEFHDKCCLTDCRVLAHIYTGSADRSNPLTCYSIRNHFRCK